jgi:hypothetical protein
MSSELITSPKAFCFVLMPFDDAFDDVYQIGIKEAATRAGAYCERVDEQIFHESILERIYNQIAKADIVVADMTNRNANVFYEVGYAHALGKRTILLTRAADDIPFDLKHFPHIVYGKSIAGLRDDLTGHIEWCVKNPPAITGSNAVTIDLFLGNENLAKGNVIFYYRPDKAPGPEITIHNASSQVMEQGTFKLAVITGPKHGYIRGTEIKSTPLPDGRYLHMLPDFETLFPQQHTSCKFTLGNSIEGESVVLRIYTKAGTRDFNLALLPIHHERQKD